MPVSLQKFLRPAINKIPAAIVKAPMLATALMLIPLFISERGFTEPDKRIAYYPAPESQSDARATYPMATLELCSDYHNNRIEFRPSPLKTQQARSILLLARGSDIDVLWTVPTQERMQHIKLVPIPIDRGLLGWRLLLIHQKDRDKFAKIQSVQALQQYIGGQGHDWPDLTVLRHNQLTVSASSTYEGLFSMLSLDHIDYFPRSISEIWPEAQAHQHQSIIIEPTLALKYRQGLYFFVNHQDEQLYRALTECLHSAARNGDLKKLFYGYYYSDITRANLHQRTVLELSVPENIQHTPLPPSYWFSVEELTPNKNTGQNANPL